MRRLLLSLVLFAMAPIASAHWAVYPSTITLSVGETSTAQPGWDHGLVMYEDRDDFVSDDPSVMYAYGYVLKSGQPGSDGITVQGLHPGVAELTIFGQTLVSPGQ